MFAHVAAIFFDLDGTLVDSVPDLTAALNRMLAQLGLPAREEVQIRAWVGNGMDNLIRRALANSMDGLVAPTLFAQAKPLYRAAYAQQLSTHSCLYPGVLEGLAALRKNGWKMACVTNKPLEFARPLLEKMGISVYFSTIVGGECVAHPKPAPDTLLLSADRLNVPITHGVMVGDSLNDVGAARNAGCAVICVPYGYNHGRDICEAKPDAIIASIADLPALLHRTESI